MIRAFGSLSIEDGERTLGPRDLGGTRPKHVLQILLAARGRPAPTDNAIHLATIKRDHIAFLTFNISARNKGRAFA